MVYQTAQADRAQGPDFVYRRPHRGTEALHQSNYRADALYAAARRPYRQSADAPRKDGNAHPGPDGGEHRGCRRVEETRVFRGNGFRRQLHGTRSLFANARARVPGRAPRRDGARQGRSRPDPLPARPRLPVYRTRRRHHAAQRHIGEAAFELRRLVFADRDDAAHIPPAREKTRSRGSRASRPRRPTRCARSR